MIRLTLLVAMSLQASYPLLAAEDGESSVRVEVLTKVEEALPDARI